MRVGDLIASLRTSPGWEAVDMVIRAELETLEDRYGSAHALDHADYALLHGRIAGLRLALNVPQALAKAAQRAEQSLDSENAAEPALT